MRRLVALCSLLGLLLGGCAMQPLNLHRGSGPVLYSFTDATGVRLEFWQKPRRIVSLNISVDEILLDVVPAERIAALTYLADDETLCSAAGKAKCVAGRVHGNNVEAILALCPDLVIVSDFSGHDYIKALREYGLKVAVLKAPDSYREVMQYIQGVAAAAGEAETGGRMTRELQHRVEYYRNRAVSAYGEQGLRSMLAISTMGVMGQRGTFSDLCYFAGVRNVLEGFDVPYGLTLSDEKVVSLNPDVLLLPSWDYNKSADLDEFRQKIVTNPAYRNLKAVREGRVYRMHDQYLYSTSQYTVKAVEELFSLVYPELAAGG